MQHDADGHGGHKIATCDNMQFAKVALCKIGCGKTAIYQNGNQRYCQIVIFEIATMQSNSLQAATFDFKVSSRNTTKIIQDISLNPTISHTF